MVCEIFLGGGGAWLARTERVRFGWQIMILMLGIGGKWLRVRAWGGGWGE